MALLSLLGKTCMLFARKGQPVQPKKILFLKLGAIGDVMMTTPLVASVREEYPKAALHYMVGNGSKEVLENNPDIDRIIPFSEEIFLKKRIGRFWSLVASGRREKYDIIFVLDKHWIFGFAALLMGGYAVGFNRAGEGEFLHKRIPYFNYIEPQKSRHDILYFLDLINSISKRKYHETQMKIYPTAKEKQRMAALLKKSGMDKKKTVCFCIGGAHNKAVGDEPARRWPLAHFIQLAAELQKRKYNIILIGGNSDKRLEQEFLKNVQRKDVLSLIGKINLRESAIVMHNASVVVCNDSGPMHIASSVNKKVVSLFGPSSPLEKAPLHKESIWLWKEEKQCYDPWGKCHGATLDMMAKISVKEVLDVVLLLV